MTQEVEFLCSIFKNFDREIVEEVLKQFPVFDNAFAHLSEFIDLDLDEDEEMEDLGKGASAQAMQDPAEEEKFNALNVYRSDSASD